MSRRHVRGMTLVELLVAMVLGLIVIGGVIGVMTANKRTYSTNQGLSQVLETARTAFELMARDIRQAGGNGCDTPTRTANVLNTGTNWWQAWWGMAGVEEGNVDPAVTTGGGVAQRVAGTDTLHVQGIEGAGLPIETHDAAGATIKINAAAPPFALADIMLVCDFDHAAIFQITGWDAGTQTLTHDASGTSPGNSSSELGFPTGPYEFPENAQIGRLLAAAWFVGNNGRPDEGGRSLYRRRLASGGTEVTEEMVAGVTDLQVRYGENDSDNIVDATGVSSWPNVNSIFITLTAESADTRVTTNPGENNGRISRSFNYLITLRNRVP
jgi:type IV pilus assembly protein PilW